MSDAEDATNEVNDDLDNEQNDYDEAVTLPPNVVDASPSTTTVSSAIESSSSAIGDEYDDEPLEDYVVKLIVNGEPDSSTSAKDLIQAGITDTIGNLPSKTSDVIDAINGYTSTVFDELAGSTTAITGEGKRFFNWSTRTWLIIGLIALCIIGLILALIFCFLGKKLGKNKRTQTTGTTSTTKAVVTKGIGADQRYEQLPKV